MNWNDIIVFVWYMLLIIIPPVVFWYVVVTCMIAINLIDMFGGLMRFLTSF